ncbi:hypothetical protein [Isoptericola sp. NPDC057391]|uniref:hypothetical protein n=1 Tax=Isoptericola sp. NPDC057391 TaxID=3346117 RepID=UPI00362C32E1
MTDAETLDVDNPTRWKLSLRVPDDWVELAGTQSAEEALGVIRGALEAVDVDLPARDAGLLLAGLRAWRDVWSDRAVLLHGLVYQGKDYRGPTAIDEEIFVNVVGSVRQIDAFDGPLSLLEVVRRVVAAKMGFDLSAAYTEGFETGIGPALGVTVTYPVDVRDPASPQVTTGATREIGLAVVVTAPSDGGPGLVLVGWSSEPHHVRAVGMLLAAMAGPARIVPVDAQGEETE